MQQPRLFFVFMLATTATLSYGQTGEFTGPYPKEPAAAIREPVHKKISFFSSHKVKAYKARKQNVVHTAKYEEYKRIELAAKERMRQYKLEHPDEISMAQLEYYRRVEVAAREHQRQLKKLSKPQYSNFLYYGHKHKPKKHPPYKMRYCKECGLRH